MHIVAIVWSDASPFVYCDNRFTHSVDGGGVQIGGF